MFPHHLDEAREQVRHGQGRERLPQCAEQLESAAGVMSGRAAQSSLQSYVTQMLLQTRA